MSKQFFPITVLNLSVVPRLMVTASLMTEFSPMMVWVFSPANFRSCGMDDTDAPGKTLTFFPNLDPSHIIALGPIQQPSSITTSFCTVAKGSMITLLPIWASGCTLACGYLLMNLFGLYWLS